MKTADIIALRRRGLSTFPVSLETKTPLVAWGRLQTHLPTTEEVQHWFRENGRAVGIAMGPVSGTILIDFDFSKGPEAMEFYRAHKWPATWTERTKSGGLHLYYRWVSILDTKKTNTTGLLHRNVDTKGAGGYSKMAPSLGYRWLRPPHLTKLAEPPAWLIDRLPARERQVLFSSDWLTDLVKAGLKEGTRNHDLTRLAGSLRSRGYSPDQIFFFLSGPASAAGVPEDEVRSICASVGKYADGQIGNGVTSIANFLKKRAPVDWIWEPFIARGSIVFVAGLPKVHKTWLMMELAVEMARGGGKVGGRFPVTSGRVVFIDQERSAAETARRFGALIAGKEIDPATLDLHIWEDGKVILDDAISLERFKKRLAELQPSAVIIDSFVTIHTANENSRGDIQAVFEKIKTIRTEVGCAMIFIDHENKQAFQDSKDEVLPSALRMVGSVGKLAALESCLTVRREDSTTFVYHTASTLGDTGAPFTVSVRDMESDRSKIAVEVR